MFKIYTTHFDVHTGAMEIYVAGCRGNNGAHCKDCHNPHIWNPDQGGTYVQELPGIIQRVEDSKPLVKSIRIYGGEPLEKPKEDIINFLTFLRKVDLPIWLFTRFEKDQVDQDILNLLDYIKCGPYIPELREDHEEFGVVLATSNQHIYKLKEDDR